MKTVITGLVHTIFPAETYGNFTKRVFWVQEQHEKYPQTWAVELTGNSLNDINGFQAGQVIKCHCEVKGKRWEKNGKEGVIVSLRATKLEKYAAQPKEESKPVIKQGTPEHDDLPF